MNRTELIIAFAVILFVVYLLGWISYWLVRKFNRVGTSNVAELDHMASALHDAEETRDEAIAYLQSREAELLGQLGQAEAELHAAMDGLGDARREVAELRAYIEENSR